MYLGNLPLEIHHFSCVDSMSDHGVIKMVRYPSCQFGVFLNINHPVSPLPNKLSLIEVSLVSIEE